MEKKLGGWQRLWIVFAVLYLLVVAALTWETWPSTSHKHAVYSKLSPEIRSRILNSQVKAENEYAFIQDARTADDSVLFRTPSGHMLVFRKALPQAEAEASAREYLTALERMTNRNRIDYLLYALTWWAVPLAFIYAFGLGLGWVYRGFKQS